MDSDGLDTSLDADFVCSRVQLVRDGQPVDVVTGAHVPEVPVVYPDYLCLEHFTVSLDAHNRRLFIVGADSFFVELRHMDRALHVGRPERARVVPRQARRDGPQAGLPRAGSARRQPRECLLIDEQDDDPYACAIGLSDCRDPSASSCRS